LEPFSFRLPFSLSTNCHYRLARHDRILAPMFRKNRERIERLEKLVEELTRHVTAPAPVQENPNATAIIAEAFGKMAGNQADLFGAMSDLALKSAARRMGIRGGTKRALTADRQPNGKFAVSPKRLRAQRKSDCRLCDDPMIRDPQIWEIQRHRQHELDGNNYSRERHEDDRPEESSDRQQEPVGSSPYQNGSAPS
jgi:hypothetical protein